MEHAKQYFDNHNTANTLYFTADNLAFFEEQDARNHAKSLDDAMITVMTRAEAEEIAASLDSDFEEEYDALDEPDAE